MMRLRTSSLLVTLCLFVAVALAGCLTAEPAPPDLSAAAIGPPPGDYKYRSLSTSSRRSSTPIRLSISLVNQYGVGSEEMTES
jgi:hypothetical protein